MSGLAERLAEVQARIATAAVASGRAPEAVTLVAVSKFHPLVAVQEAYSLGVRTFGENYAQELRDKAAALPDAKWHFIGRFQKNKINMLKDIVACFETVSSADDAEALLSRAPAAHMLLQVNIGLEPQKGGVTPVDVLSLAEAFPTLQGLMCIPPEGASERSFQAMAKLRHQLEDALGKPMALSMGMSADFELAIHCGATHVRVGSLIFGPRVR